MNNTHYNFRKILLLVFLWSAFAFAPQEKQNEKLIKGKWLGNVDDIYVTLSFDSLHFGYIKYSTSKKNKHFKYHFENDSVMKIADGKSNAFHLIHTLNMNKLILIPYPDSLNETIELINEIEFLRGND